MSNECQNECPICFESIKCEDTYSTPCKHVFHKGCMLRHQQSEGDRFKRCSNCPLCRCKIAFDPSVKVKEEPVMVTTIIITPIGMIDVDAMSGERLFTTPRQSTHLSDVERMLQDIAVRLAFLDRL